jgi:hypothetical protein
MLVPVPQPAPQAQYDAQYPQPRAATTPGMELPYDDRQPIPPGYRLVEQRRRGLIIAGSIVTGIPWAFSVTGAVAADFDNESGFLLIPALGPWLMLAAGGAKNRDCGSDDFGDACNSDQAGLRAVLVLDGLAQTAGAVMFVAGMASTRKRLVRNDVLVGVAPVRMGRDGYGLGVHGSF